MVCKLTYPESKCVFQSLKSQEALALLPVQLYMSRDGVGAPVGCRGTDTLGVMQPCCKRL